MNNIPTYHPFDNSFINDPSSFKFIFTSREDMLINDIHCSCDEMESSTFTRKKHIPKKEKKKKKYVTKPKNNNKIAKIKASRYNRS